MIEREGSSMFQFYESDLLALALKGGWFLWRIEAREPIRQESVSIREAIDMTITITETSKLLRLLCSYTTFRAFVYKNFRIAAFPLFFNYWLGRGTQAPSVELSPILLPKQVSSEGAEPSTVHGRLLERRHYNYNLVIASVS